MRWPDRQAVQAVCSLRRTGVGILLTLGGFGAITDSFCSRSGSLCRRQVVDDADRLRPNMLHGSGTNTAQRTLDNAARFVNVCVDLTVVLLQDRLDVFVVNGDAALEVRQDEPGDEGHLGFVVKRQPEQDAVAKEFDGAESRDHDPVHEPSAKLLLFVRCVESLEGCIRGVQVAQHEAEKVRNSEWDDHGGEWTNKKGSVPT